MRRGIQCDEPAGRGIGIALDSDVDKSIRINGGGRVDVHRTSVTSREGGDQIAVLRPHGAARRADQQRDPDQPKSGAT